MDIFKRNLAALNAVDSRLCALLSRITPNANLEVFVGKDSADINFLDTKNNAFLFNGNTIESTLEKVKEFGEFALYPYLYCFGLGNGIFYKILLENPQLKRLIVIEPNIEIIFAVLNLIDFSRDVESKRLIIWDTNAATRENIHTLFASNKNALIYTKLYNLHIFNAYYDAYMREAVKINKLFIEMIEHCVVSLGNDSKDAIIGISHHIANLTLMLRTPSLINLAQNAKNTQSAIIVSTGPSLYKQLPLLKTIAPYATIFCIDASFPILAKYGIKPDIVLSLERVEESARFYAETPSEAFKGVIFEITSIAHKTLLDTIKAKGGILQISQRPFGYTSYFDLREYGYIGIGMSAANMAFELVVHSGFSECVLIGQDLAFGADGKSHSKGAVYGEDEIKKSDEIVLLPKYGGGGEVESTKVWKLFWNFFAKDINDTKHLIRVINATEGGARIPGTIEMSFSDAVAKIDRRNPKKPIILMPPDSQKMRENLQKAQKKVREIIKYGRQKQQKIEHLFLQVAQKIEEIEALNAQNRLESFDFTSLNAIFDEIEGIKGLFSSKKFLDIFNEATQAYIFHQECEIAKIVVKRADDTLAQNAKKLEWLYAHKQWLFSLAGCIDSVIYCVNENYEAHKGEFGSGI